jgi:hypothetical protein
VHEHVLRESLSNPVTAPIIGIGKNGNRDRVRLARAGQLDSVMIIPAGRTAGSGLAGAALCSAEVTSKEYPVTGLRRLSPQNHADLAKRSHRLRMFHVSMPGPVTGTSAPCYGLRFQGFSMPGRVSVLSITGSQCPGVTSGAPAPRQSARRGGALTVMSSVFVFPGRAPGLLRLRVANLNDRDRNPAAVAPRSAGQPEAMAAASVPVHLSLPPGPVTLPGSRHTPGYRRCLGAPATAAQRCQ